MADFAIIQTGGKQYKVQTGDTIKVEKLTAKVGEKIEFTDLFDGKKVQAEVMGEEKQPKVTVLKFHPKKRFQRTVGHRQINTTIKIAEIK